MKLRLLKCFCAALTLALLGGCGGQEKAPEKIKEAPDKKTAGGIKAGDTLVLGAYGQGTDAAEKEALSWLVLSVEGNKALVISAVGIDSRLYNDEAIEVDWESSSLRAWLNGTFLEEAFTAEERGRILSTELAWEDNPSYPGIPGKSATDRVFLLSISEAEQYFASDEARLCKPNALSVLHEVYVEEEKGACAWWLRNSGAAPEMAALVDVNGVISHVGDGVYCEGFAVRPAMWISLS